MKNNHNSHYFSKTPQADLKILSIAESLRGHLYILKTTPGVFSYRKIDLGTKTFIKYMEVPKTGATLLDMGCGYGPIGIVLANICQNCVIYMVDINRRAIWCSRENIKINQVTNVNILSGSYFEPILPLDLKFDGIYTNPPMKKGKKEFLKLCNLIPSYLKHEGTFQFVIRRTMGANDIYQILKDNLQSMDVEVRYKRSGYWVFFCRKQ